MADETTIERQQKILGRARLARLHGSQVTVFGVGLLGGALSMHLGLLRIPQILVDPGEIEHVNLGNQSFPADRVGDAKVAVRSDQIRALNPASPVRWLNVPLEAVGLGVFADSKLLISGLDSRVSRVRVAQISFELGIPWLDLAVDGSGARRHGTITLWDPREPDSGCYCCRYSDDELDQIRREGRGPGCQSWSGSEVIPTAPTLVSSPFGHVIASWGALWAVEALLGGAADRANSQLQIFGDGDATLRRLVMQRSTHCRQPHLGLGPLQRVEAETIGELDARATADLGFAPEALQLHGRQFVPHVHCRICNARREMGRLAESIHESELRCPCNPGALRVPTSQQDHLTRKDIGLFANRRWTEVGLPRADVVTASAPNHKDVHYIPSNA